MDIQQDSPDIEDNKLPSSNISSWIHKIKWRLVIAFLCIAGDIVSWTIRAEFFQGIEKIYNKPIFISYVVHSSYLFFLLAWLVLRYFPLVIKSRKLQPSFYSFKYYLLISFFFTIVIFAFNYTWYLSLPRTEVSTNTAIYESATAFVFLISVPILGERVTLVKVLSLIISIGGVCLISLSPSGSATNHTIINFTNLSNITTLNDSIISESTLGYFLVVLSTIIYSLYEVLYKRFATSPKDTAPIVNTIRILGLIGIWYIILVAPFLIIAHFTGLERFELPSLNVALEILLNSVLDSFSNILILIGIVLSSPLFISMGALLALPTSMLADYIFHNILMSYLSILGSVFILMGFLGFMISTLIQDYTDKNTEKSKCFSLKKGWKLKHYLLLYSTGWYPIVVQERGEPLLDSI